MANQGFGLRLVGRIGGGEPRIRQYYVPSTDSTALYQGDVVMIPSSGGTLDPTNIYPVVTAWASGDVAVGVVIGFKPLPAQPYTAYRLASTATYLEVCDDPYAIYEVQEDGVTSRVTKAEIGQMYNAPLTVAAGSTVLGVSGTMLTSNSTTTSASDVKIIGVRADQTNPGLVAGTTGAILLVTLSSMALTTADSIG